MPFYCAGQPTRLTGLLSWERCTQGLHRLLSWCATYGWCFLGSWFFRLCTSLRWCHFLWSVVELAVVPVCVADSPAFPGALGPPPFWRLSCLYCCRARLTASSTNLRLTLRSSASSGSGRPRPPARKHRILLGTFSQKTTAGTNQTGAYLSFQTRAEVILYPFNSCRLTHNWTGCIRPFRKGKRKLLNHPHKSCKKWV